MNQSQPHPSIIIACLTSILGLFAFGLPILAQANSPTLSIEDNPDRRTLVSMQNYEPPADADAPSRTESGGSRGGSGDYEPPDRGAPDGTEGPGTRGGCSVSNEKPLTALIPEKRVGLTTSAYPTIFFYIPPTPAKQAEFVLQDENKQQIYKTNFNIPSKSGVVSLSITANSTFKGLEVGKNYRWGFSIICNSQDRSKDRLVGGLIQRVQLPQEMVAKIEKATMRDRVNLYAENGIWYDTLATYAQQRRDNPNNSELAKDWANLLKQVGLEEIAAEPLVQTNSLP